jgi:hypothetical protein
MVEPAPSARESWQASAVAVKADLRDWVIEALDELGGHGSVVDVCEVVWRRHEPDLRRSGDLFYTWQYDIRWAAQNLRDSGLLDSMNESRRGPWRLASESVRRRSV